MTATGAGVGGNGSPTHQSIVLSELTEPVNVIVLLLTSLEFVLLAAVLGTLLYRGVSSAGYLYREYTLGDWLLT